MIVLFIIVIIRINYRGYGEVFQLGHGDEEHVRTPKLIKALEGHIIVDVSIGKHHCIVLTADGKVYAWGKNTSGEVDDSEDIVPEPRLLENVSMKDIVAVYGGAYEVCNGYWDHK